MYTILRFEHPSAHQSICSVPAFTIHHLESIWGDPFAYRPERWLESEEKSKQLDKAFVPVRLAMLGPYSHFG